MKKILCLLFCLVLLLPLNAAKAEMLPVEDAMSVAPISEDDELSVYAAATTQYNYKVGTYKEYSIQHGENTEYCWHVLWSVNGTSWTYITNATYNNVNYYSNNFSLRADYNSNIAYITFYKTGTYYIRFITQTPAWTNEIYCFDVGVLPSITMDPTSVSLTGGSSADITVLVSDANVNSYKFYSNNPKVASAGFGEDGFPMVEAWNTGTATIYFTGYGDYGNASASCKVTVTGTSVAKPIRYCSVNGIADQSYSGSPITPHIDVEDDYETLVEGTDYKLTYQNNTNPGTATVTVTGIGAYTGKIQADFIIRQPIDGATVTLSGASGLVYNGEAKKPTAKVTLSGKTLIEGTDYTVSYKNNTNAGTGTVVITGIGNYIGSAEKNFTIAKGKQVLKIDTSEVMIDNPVYLEISGAKTSLSYSSSDTTVASVSSGGRLTGEKEGEVTITVKAEENSNYNSATVSKKVKVTKFHGTCGENLTWEWDHETKTFTVYGSGNMDEYSSYDYLPWNNITTQIETVIIQPGATSIGHYAFGGCTSLTNVSIPETVTYISTAFIGCNNLKTIALPQKLKDIGRWAFANCFSLEEIAFPDSLTNIGEYAFHKCTSLTSINIPSSVKELGGQAFSQCTNLKSAIIGASFLGGGLFAHCGNLSNVTLLPSVTELDGDVFYECRSLTSLIIPHSVTSIDKVAIHYCDNLRNVWYRGTREEWDTFEISGVSNKFNLYCLESNAFRLPASLRAIDSSALSGIAAETIYIPIGVTEIKAKAFANCPNLKTLVFDGSPESISDDMLSGCTDVSILARSGSTAAAWARNHGISVSYY